MRQTIKIISIITLVTFLAACGLAAPVPIATATFAPSYTPSSTPTIPTATFVPTSTSPIPISSAPDGLRIAYVIDGNLYFQDGSKPTLQLTYDKVRDPEYRRLISFSEDGDSIFYFQGSSQENLYSIHVDGIQKQVLLSNSLLLKLSSEYDEATTLCSLILVPHTSFVLVRTCTYLDVNIIMGQDDLLLVDTVTSETKVLLPPGTGSGSYTPSPDGSMVAFADSGRIHIIGIDGKMVRRNLATYVPGDRYDPDAIDARIYWLPDSSGLILALPIRTINDPGLPQTYEICRYSLNTSIVTRINLDPPVTGRTPVRVSPDGNWITYTNRDEDISYLGDLQDGHTYSYGPADLFEWSPDSMHFLYISSERNNSGVYLASIHEPSTLLFGRGEYFYEFVCWLDASRYVYLGEGGYAIREIGGDPRPILTGNIRPLIVYGNMVFHYQPSRE